MARQPQVPDPLATPTLSVEQAGQLLGMGRVAAYAAANRGDFPVLRIGKRLIVPTAKLLAMLGLAPEVHQ